MKSWLITEDEIRDIIRNCEEVVKSGGGLDNSAHCVIREHNLKNPIFHAIFFAVTLLNEDKIKFAERLSFLLQEVINKEASQDRSVFTRTEFEERIKKIHEKAIEVET